MRASGVFWRASRGTLLAPEESRSRSSCSLRRRLRLASRRGVERRAWPHGRRAQGRQRRRGCAACGRACRLCSRSGRCPSDAGSAARARPTPRVFQWARRPPHRPAHCVAVAPTRQPLPSSSSLEWPARFSPRLYRGSLAEVSLARFYRCRSPSPSTSPPRPRRRRPHCSRPPACSRAMECSEAVAS